MITRLASKADFGGILELQETNLFENLQQSARNDGFVTTRFTVSQLEAVLVGRGLFVAERDGVIVGYAMAAGWDFFSQWPIFPHMISRLSGRECMGLRITSANTFQYGPICVGSSARGTGTFPRLFEELRRAYSSRYDVGLTFINQKNQRSLKAHTSKLGMVVIDEFEFCGRDYYSLAFETTRSVLPLSS